MMFIIDLCSHRPDIVERVFLVNPVLVIPSLISMNTIILMMYILHPKNQFPEFCCLYTFSLHSSSHFMIHLHGCTLISQYCTMCVAVVLCSYCRYLSLFLIRGPLNINSCNMRTAFPLVTSALLNGAGSLQVLLTELGVRKGDFKKRTLRLSSCTCDFVIKQFS